MSQSISEQVMTIERSLGERMIEHALVIVRAWLTELGENNRYEASFKQIQDQYKALCAEWLIKGEEAVEVPLNKLTGDMYQLADAVFVDLCLLKGMVPTMHGFNPENKESVMQYFAHCVTLKQEDLDWLRSIADDEDKAPMALLAAGALSNNLREYFNINSLLTLIDCMNAQCQIVADECKAFVSSLLIRYDVRIDFFEQIQEAFLQAVMQMDDNGLRVVDVIGLLIQYSKENGLEQYAQGLYRYSWLPEDLRKVLEFTGMDKHMDACEVWLPQAESEYINNLVQIFPDTWLYKQLVEGEENREQYIALCYLYSGRMDLLWDNPAYAEEWLKRELRAGSRFDKHLINYAHCMMLKGDRVMAYEYYRMARNSFSSSKDFFALFRPDRRALIDHGVPMEDVYMMEDLLLKGDS